MYSPADSHPFPPSYTGSTEALSPAGDFFWPTALPWSCLTAAAQQVIRSPRLAVRSGAPYPPLPQTCASGSSREAPFQLHPFALLFNVHIKGVKEITRSASYRKSVHALHHSPTVASFTLQTQEFIPRKLARGFRMNSSAGNKHHFSPTCATQRAGRSSPQRRRRQQREQQLLSPPLTSSSISPCRRDAILVLPHRQRSERVDPVCLSARRLIKLHPGLWVPTLLPSYGPAETKAPLQG